MKCLEYSKELFKMERGSSDLLKLNTLHKGEIFVRLVYRF